MNQIHYLKSFTSTSLDRNASLKTLFKDLKEEIPVLFEINMKNGSEVGFNFNMSSEMFTIYPEEKEVLLDDGIALQIKNVFSRNTYDGKPFTTIQMDFILQSKKYENQLADIQVKYGQYIDGVVLGDQLNNKFYSKTNMKGKLSTPQSMLQGERIIQIT